MKRLLAGILALSMMFALTSCGAKETPAPSAPAASAPAAPAAPAEKPAEPAEVEQPHAVIKMCMKSSGTSALGLGVQKWVELVNAMDGVNLELQFYPDAQLGNESEMMEQILMGENLCLISDAGVMSGYGSEELAVLDGPYLADSVEAYLKVPQTKWFNDRRAEFEAAGLYVPEVYFVFGQRHLICTDPVRQPSDLNGKKIRSTSAQVSISTVEAMGATATPLAYADMYTSLSQGVIDGAENPLAALYSTKLYETAKYVCLTGHQTTLSMFVMNNGVFNGLTDVQKEAFISAGQEAADYYNNEILTSATEDAIAAFEQEGVTIIDDVDVAAFREATMGVWSEIDQWGAYDKIMSEIA